MNKYWLMIVGASFFEVGWVIGLKHSQTIGQYALTLVGIILSFYYLIKATQHLSVGTAYAVFVGLGTLGTVLMDTVLFDAPVTGLKLMFIGLLMLGVIGLKLLADHPQGGK